MILFIIINFIGILLTFLSIVLLNKKNKFLSLENIIISFILFLISFFIFSKIGFVLINLKIDIKGLTYFITSNHAFIGGYIGAILFVPLVSKLFNCNKKDLMILYLPNMLLLYSILKIGCYINGCCSGKLFIPIQILESILNFIAYIYIIYLILKKENKINVISNSILLFGLLRLILSLFRIYYLSYTFIIVEIICLSIIIYSFIFRWKETDKK